MASPRISLAFVLVLGLNACTFAQLPSSPAPPTALPGDERPTPAPQSATASVPVDSIAEAPNVADAPSAAPILAPIRAPAQAPEVEESELLLNATITLSPGIIAISQRIAPKDAASALRITAEAKLCDATGRDCSGASSLLDVEPQFQLACANDDATAFPFFSNRIAAQQEVMIPPGSVSYVAVNDTAPSFICQLSTRDYLPAPIQVSLKATSVPLSQVPVTSQSEEVGAGALYDTCCDDDDACTTWKQVVADRNLDPKATFADICRVPGCACNSEGNLIVLDLISFDLRCPLASIDFSPFPQLEALYLSSNNLTGDFTRGVERIAVALPALKELRVDANPSLGGDLNGGGDEGNGLCAMAIGGLEQLIISASGISGRLPSCLFGPGSTLRQIYGSASKLSGELPPLEGATSLEVLQVALSQLSGEIPPLPPSLLKLNLSMNQLEGQIPALPISLLMLDLSNNELSGPVPDSAADHPRLWQIDLRANELTGVPGRWVQPAERAAGQWVQALRQLYLEHNPLQTGFPVGLSYYPSLQVLDVTDASIQGTLPELDESAFPSLLALFAANNDGLEGQLPESWQNINIFKLAGVEMGVTRKFILANNSLSGSLPEWLGQAYPLTDIDLSGNDFDNGCDPQFAELGACGETTPTNSLDQPQDTGNDGSDEADVKGAADEGGGGLSSGAIAGIVIVALLLVGGAGGYVLWRRKRHGSSRFQKFEDEGGVEMGAARNNVYNPGLSP